METLVGGYFIFVLILMAVSIAAWVHGLILAFRANIILGIVCLFIEPAFFIFAVVYWITRVDLAAKIVELFEA